MNLDREQASDIIAELIAICRKHKCVMLAGQGVFYLARIESEIPNAIAPMVAAMGVQPKAAAIAQIREINPTMAEWANVDEEKPRMTQ